MFEAAILCNIKENYRCKLEKMAKNLISGLIFQLELVVRQFFLKNNILMNRWTFTNETEILNLVEFITII